MRRLQTSSKWTALLLAIVLVGVSGVMPKAWVSAEPSPPEVAAILPDRAANDVDTPVEISGSGFSNEGSVPQVFLGSTALNQVTWVSESRLTAQVPWGMEAGQYGLRVINPDGSEDTLDSAFEVTDGVGQWNTNAIDGGPVQAVLPIASIEGLVYAYSWTTSAVYRSTDAGAHWSTVGHAAGQFFTYDSPDPDHLYLYLNNQQSTDGGATWHDLLDGRWPGTDSYPGPYTQVFPDPAHSGTIFLASATIPASNPDPSGLLRSTDYGQTWDIVDEDLGDDNHVTAMDFSDDYIYLGTRDGNLYQSADGGENWDRMGSTIALPSIGVLKVNPYDPMKIWITTHFSVTANAQMATVDLSDDEFPVTDIPWQPQSYPKTLGFLSADSVFVGTHWDNGWLRVQNPDTFDWEWNLFQPSTGKPGYSLALSPWDEDDDKDIDDTFYIADEQYGVQKTTNHGLTWSPINTGLHAMSPDYLAVDPDNPSWVYAKIADNGWPGIFVSADGGQNWDFSPLPQDADGPRPVTSMLAVSGERVFAGAHGNGVDNNYGPQVFISEDQGVTWRQVIAEEALGYEDPDNSDPDNPAPYFHMPITLKADPNHPEKLLMTVVIGSRNMTSDQYVSEIYRSVDAGDTWQAVGLEDEANLNHPVNNLGQLAFDPNDPNIVYAAGDHAILKSEDNGLTWRALIEGDDLMLNGPIAVEPVAPYRVYVGNLVSADGGATWDGQDLPIGVSQMVFVPGSDTLYIAGDGLAFSNDGGDTWQFPQGALASARINGLAVSRSSERTVVYVGTPGGEMPNQPLSAARLQTEAPSNSFEAGVYRLTEVEKKIFLPFVKH